MAMLWLLTFQMEFPPAFRLAREINTRCDLLRPLTDLFCQELEALGQSGDEVPSLLLLDLLR